MSQLLTLRQHDQHRQHEMPLFVVHQFSLAGLADIRETKTLMAQLYDKFLKPSVGFDDLKQQVHDICRRLTRFVGT